jgi:branched-chain amino acid transport system substrate-binding protein
MKTPWSMAMALVAFSTLAAGTVAPASGQNPIVVGASISQTGRLAVTAAYVNQAYQIWVDDVNAKGGLLGRPVMLKVYDDKSDPGTGAKLYEKLVVDDKVDLVVGPYSTPVTAAASTVTEKYKKVMVAPMAAGDALWKRGYRYLIQTLTPSSLYYVGVVDIALDRGFKTVALFSEDSEALRVATPAVVELAQKKGLTIVHNEYFPRGTTDFSAILTRIKALRADVLICGCYEPESILSVRQSKELDYNPKLLFAGHGAAVSEFYKALGKDAELALASDHWDPRMKTPGNAEFVERFKKKYGREPIYHAAGTYGAMQVLEAAVRKAGSLDQDRIRQALVELDMQTIFGHYKVNETGAQVGKTAVIVQWQGGKKEIVWPGDTATANAMLPAPPWAERR